MSAEDGKVLSDQIFDFLQEQPQITELNIEMPRIWISHNERTIELQGSILKQEELEFKNRSDLFENEASLNKILLFITR